MLDDEPLKLRESLNCVEKITNTRVVVCHGINVDLDLDLSEVYDAMVYPDGYLHLIVK